MSIQSSLSVSILASTLAATLFCGVVGCGSKQKAKPVEPVAATRTASKHKQTSQAKPKVERATGQLREALIQLRRVHFSLDSAELRPEARQSLGEAAERLASFPKVHIYIDGHTDIRGTTEYNVALGERRSRAVFDYLTRLGIDAKRLHVISFGKEQPLDEGRSRIAYAKNRRVDFRLQRGDVRFVLDEGVLYDDKSATISLSE